MRRRFQTTRRTSAGGARRPFVRLVAPLFVLLMCVAVAAHAKPLFKRIFVRTYPETRDTKLDACETCHLGEEALNPYGLALQKAGMQYTDVEALDSDGDGVTNIAEIKALTNPGDAKSRPGAKPDSAKKAKPDSTAKAKPDSTKAKPDSVKAGAKADSAKAARTPGAAAPKPGGPGVVSARPDSTVADTSYAPATRDTM